MDSLQLSELQTFINNHSNSTKGELNSKKLIGNSFGYNNLDVLDPILERALDIGEYLCSDIVANISSTPISSDYSGQQSSLPQVVLDATALVHEEKYPGEGSVLPHPVVNFLEPDQSPDHSDGTSYYSDDSNADNTSHMPEFSQLTSPSAEAPRTSFQWPSCSNIKREHTFLQNSYENTPCSSTSSGSRFGARKPEDFNRFKSEEYGLPSCQQSLGHSSAQPGVSSVTSESSAFPFVTSPSQSLPSPTSTIYSASSPGTPGPSGSTRGRRPHGSIAPYSTKSRRRQVEKGTVEYVEKRARNNIAVRKSRAKAKEKQRETETRVHSLLEQNEQLQKKVDLLTKELTVLKGLFLNIGASIPDEFLKLIGDS